MRYGSVSRNTTKEVKLRVDTVGPRLQYESSSFLLHQDCSAKRPNERKRLALIYLTLAI